MIISIIVLAVPITVLLFVLDAAAHSSTMNTALQFFDIEKYSRYWDSIFPRTLMFPISGLLISGGIVRKENLEIFVISGSAVFALGHFIQYVKIIRSVMKSNNKSS